MRHGAMSAEAAGAHNMQFPFVPVPDEVPAHLVHVPMQCNPHPIVLEVIQEPGILDLLRPGYRMMPQGDGQPRFVLLSFLEGFDHRIAIQSGALSIELIDFPARVQCKKLDSGLWKRRRRALKRDLQRIRSLEKLVVEGIRKELEP